MIKWIKTLGAVDLPSGWFDSGCGTGPRARWLPNGRIEIEGEGTPTKELSNQIPKWMPTIQEMATKYGVPASLIAGIMMTESAGQPYAKSYCCYGLMGFLPKTASSYAGRTVTGNELQDDPKLSIELGAKMLAALMNQYKGNVIKVATSYNAGGPYCTPAKGCSTVNRWGMRADCVNGQAIDYPTRVISYANASLGAQPGGAILPSSSSPSSGLGFWSIAGLAALGIAGVVWANKSGALKKLRDNPLSGLQPGQVVRLRLERVPVLHTPGYVESMRETSKTVVVVSVQGDEVFVKDTKPSLRYAGTEKRFARRYTWRGDQLVSTQKPPVRYYVLGAETVASGALRSNPETVQLIMRATTLLQYMSPEEAIETLARDIGRDRAYLIVKAAEIRAKDIGPELASNPRKAKPRFGHRQRLYCIAREENVLTYECSEQGHTFKQALVDPLGHKLVSGAVMIASWHSRDKGGATGVCPKCEKLRKLKENPKKLYEYALTLRPVSFATVPKGFASFRQDSKYPHGVVQYEKPLSRANIEHFDLLPLDPLDPINVGKRYAAFKEKVLDKFSQKNIYVIEQPDGTKSSLTYSTRQGVDYQFTFWDENEQPTGHIDVNDFDEAVKLLWGEELRAKREL